MHAILSRWPVIENQFNLKTYLLLETCHQVTCCAFFCDRTFGPLSRICERETAVSHISIDAEIISLETRFRMEGVLGPSFWERVVPFIPSTMCRKTLLRVHLMVFGDQDMIIKRRRQNVRQVSRTLRVDLDWLFDRMNLDPTITIRCVNTEEHHARCHLRSTFDDCPYHVGIFQ